MVAERDGFRRQVDDAVLVLFALVSEAVGWATTALLDEDLKLADQVITDDHGIDERCEALTGTLKERLAGPPLSAVELEDLIAIIQIVPELERSADLAEHIAQRARRSLGGVITPKSRGLIQRMSDVAVGMWKVAGDAYRRRSRDASFSLQDADDELDTLASSLVAEGVTAGGDAQVAVDLALIARFYERLGDHAVNLASRVETMGKARRLGGSWQALSRRSAAPDQKRPKGRRAARSRPEPAEQGFFELFEAAAINCRDCAEGLGKLLTTLSDEDFQNVKAHERVGDQITLDLLRLLDATNVTPYDREDIHALGEELDDVVDDIFAAASLIELVGDDETVPEMTELVDTMVAMSDELVALVGCLRSGEGARVRLERIEHLERQGDAIFRRGMGRLFSGDYEALSVIKLKDIIGSMEASLNAIEDVSNVIEGILFKNS